MELSSPFPEPFDRLLFSSFESALAHRGYMSWLSFYERRSRLVMFLSLSLTALVPNPKTLQARAKYLLLCFKERLPQSHCYLLFACFDVGTCLPWHIKFLHVGSFLFTFSLLFSNQHPKVSSSAPMPRRSPAQKVDHEERHGAGLPDTSISQGYKRACSSFALICSKMAWNISHFARIFSIKFPSSVHVPSLFTGVLTSN